MAAPWVLWALGGVPFPPKCRTAELQSSLPLCIFCNIDVSSRNGYTTPNAKTGETMRGFTAVIERCPQTGLYVGYVPGFPGAHSQGDSLDELNRNLREVIEMLLEDGEPVLEAEFVGLQQVVVQ
jgi:predicted RNase H-like HicB family nuclease